MVGKKNKKMDMMHKKIERQLTAVVELDPETAALAELSEILKAPPQLEKDEVELFTLVSLGKVHKVKDWIETEKRRSMDFNNIVDDMGYSIFHIAIRRQNEAMLDYLLTLPNIEIWYDLLLHAIQEQNMSIINKLIAEIRHKHPKISGLSQLKRWKYSEYPKDITPVILSAQIGSYNLIKYFYEQEKEERFQPIHTPVIGSMDPRNPLDMSKNYLRLHEYQTRASPEMLCYRTNTEATFDPIYEGFNLLKELKRVGNEEHEFNEHYDEIRVKLSKFLLSFLDECKSTEDVKLILTQEEGYSGTMDKYPRLMWAMEIQFPEFVTHCHSQKIMYMMWAGDSWPAWQDTSFKWKVGHILLRLLLTPFICLWLHVDCVSNRAKFFRTPINRSIHHFVSYVYFLILLMWEAYFFIEKDLNLHNTPCLWLECVIILFALGHDVTLCRIFLVTPRNFFFTPWNWYDMIKSASFSLTFICWAYTWMTEWMNPIVSLRKHWLYYDSVLLGEASFAVSIVLGFGAFFRFFQLSHETGPIHVTMASIIGDVLLFLLFFFVVMLSFGLGIFCLYSPFAGKSGMLYGQEASVSTIFGNFGETFHSLYWGIIGMGDATAGTLVSFEKPLDTASGNATKTYNSLTFTAMTGSGIWMVYHVLGIMILMNMLTGYMGNTFSRISGNMTETWKFHRTQAWIYYTRNTVMPAPFNLIPSLRDFRVCCQWIIPSEDKHDSDKIAVCSVGGCCYFDEQARDSKSRVIRYGKLMKTLTQRYLRSKLTVNESDPATNDDVEQIMDKVIQLKELLNPTPSTPAPSPVPSPFRQSFTPERLHSDPHVQPSNSHVVSNSDH